MSKKKIILCVVCVFALGIGIALFVTNSVAQYQSRVSRSIYKQLQTQMQKTGEIAETVNLADYTDFDWDEVIIYGLSTVENVEKEFGIKPRIRKKDVWIQGVIFYYQNKVVHHEYYTFDFDDIPKDKIAIYPAKFSDNNKRIQLKKEQSVFSVSYHEDGSFRLFPIEAQTNTKQSRLD